MNLESLRFFCAVVEESSFHAAALRLHRSQPAVSQQIKALERRLGHPLLERKTCSPTPIGQLLYERSRGILNDADSLKRELADFDETAGRELRVGTSDTTALYFLPPYVRAFSTAMPQTRLVVVNRPSGAIAEQVLRGELDLGIVTLPVSSEELEEKELFRQQLVLLMPRSHHLCSRKNRKLSLKTLKDESFLLLQEETLTGTLLREYFAREAFEPQVVLDSGSFEVIKRFVAEGIGLSFLPENAITDKDEALVTADIEGLPSVSIGAVWRRGAYQTRAEKTFLELISSEM